MVKRNIMPPMFFVVGCCLFPSAPVAASDWPTLQHDMQRTGTGPAAPRPPYRYRWVWINGQRVSPGKLARATKNRVAERWFPKSLIPALVQVRFHPLAQPMVRDGAAYIGSIGGEMIAVDVKTGRTRWKVPAGGPILHSVTVGQSQVFAGTLNGVDAFGLDGKKHWTFVDPHRGGFWSCPAVVDNLVLIGGTSGHFFGIDAASGELKWSFDAGAEIYVSPAVDQRSVYFAAENMHAYALDAATGKLKWTSQRLAGYSFGHYWPVVAQQAGVVIFRTMGLRPPSTAAAVVKKAPHDYDQAQSALKAYLVKNPSARTCFILNLSDGHERVSVPAGQFGWGGDAPPPPLVRSDGAVLMFHYAKQGSFQADRRWSLWGDADAPPIDLGIVDFQQGRFQRLGPTGSRRYFGVCRWDDFCQFTMGGQYLFGYETGYAFGCMPINGKGPRLNMDLRPILKSFIGGAYADGFNRRGRQGAVGFYGRPWGGMVSATPLPDVVLINCFAGTAIAAMESKRGK